MVFGKVLVLAVVVVCMSQRACGIATLRLTADDSKIPGQYIVVLKDEVDVNSFTRDLEASVLRTPSEGTIGHRYQHALNGFSAKLSDEALKNLLKSEYVKYVEEDGITQIEALASWGLGRIDQRNHPLAGSYLDFLGDGGSGTNIYVIDTGIRLDQTDFSLRIGDGYDYEPSNNCEDCHGHGTFVTGIAAGFKYGVAKKATIHPVRAFSCTGSGTYEDLIKGMDWVIANKGSNAVASFSVSTPTSTAVNEAVKRMHDAGIVVVAASGNQGIDASLRSPGSAAETITVGAINPTDIRPSWSNYGSSVDIFAPGVTIGSDSNAGPTSSSYNSGTSFACPHVSGAAAILRGMKPSLTPTQVRAELIASSTKNLVKDPQGSANRLLYIGTSGQCMPGCTTLMSEPGRVESEPTVDPLALF